MSGETKVSMYCKFCGHRLHENRYIIIPPEKGAYMDQVTFTCTDDRSCSNRALARSMTELAEAIKGFNQGGQE